MHPELPDFIVHYSRGEPFRSITSVHGDDFHAVLKTLNETNAWGLARFSDPEYLAQRHQVESDLRRRFIEIGGKPVLRNPIYFFLGRHPRFEEHEGNLGYVISLQDLDPCTISFTYGDSMFCFHGENRRRAGDAYRNPLCDGLYLLKDLPRLPAHPGYPGTEPLKIEAQLWTRPDAPSVKALDR